MGINVSLLEKKLIPNYIPQVTEISSLIYNGVFSRKCVLPDGYCYGGIWNIVNSFKKPNGKYAFTWSPPPVDTCNGDLNNTVSTAFDCSGLSQERVAQDAIDLDGDGIYQLSCVDAIKSTNNSYNWESLLTCNFELDPSKTVKAQVHPSYECVNKDSDPGYCLESAGYSLVNFIDQPEGQSFRWNLAPPPIDTCDGNITNNLDNKFNCSNLSVGYYDGDYFAVNPETNLVNNLSDKDGDGVFEFNCRDAAQSNDFDLSKPKWFQSNVTCFYEPDQNSSIEVFEEISLLAGNTANNGEVTISIPSGLSGSDYQVQLDCSYFQGECIRGLSEPIVIDNIFDPVTLTINKFGEGSVVDNNTVCGDTRGFCSNIYERGSVVTLIPIAPDTTSIFAGWTGNNSCFGTGPCELVMDGNQSVNAIFSRRAVTLLAIPNIGSVFKGWSGECLETGQCFVSDSEECTTDIPCAITFGSDQAVSAEFVESPVLTVNISGAGTPTIIIKGVEELNAGICQIIPDRMETGSFALLAAATKSELKITKCNPEHILNLLAVFKKIGVNYEVGTDWLLIKKSDNIKAYSIRTHEYPGFPTDLQSPYVVLMTQAKGISLIHETIYNRRLIWTDMLSQMGANIIMCDPHRVVINGPTQLAGKKIISPDIRAGIALVIAALVAEGVTEIDNIYQIDRGYAKLEERLRGIGADIERVE